MSWDEAEVQRLTFKLERLEKRAEKAEMALSMAALSLRTCARLSLDPDENALGRAAYANNRALVAEAALKSKEGEQ